MRMCFKLAITCVGLGLMALSLVAIRETRTRAANQLVQCRLRMIEHDQALWSLRARIGEEVAPWRLRERLPELEQVPMPAAPEERAMPQLAAAAPGVPGDVE